MSVFDVPNSNLKSSHRFDKQRFLRGPISSGIREYEAT